MKKMYLFILIFILAYSVTGFAQAFEKGDKLLNIGVGVNSYYSGGFPLNASFEVGVTDDISVGATFDFLSHRYSYLSDYRFTALYFGARGSYHFNRLFNLDIDNLDIYGGAEAGYRSFSWGDKFSGVLSNRYGSGPFFGGFAGVKYYFKPSIGAYAEAGAIGSTNARLGVTFKF